MYPGCDKELTYGASRAMHQQHLRDGDGIDIIENNDEKTHIVEKKVDNVSNLIPHRNFRRASVQKYMNEVCKTVPMCNLHHFLIDQVVHRITESEVFTYNQRTKRYEIGRDDLIPRFMELARFVHQRNDKYLKTLYADEDTEYRNMINNLFAGEPDFLSLFKDDDEGKRDGGGSDAKTVESNVSESSPYFSLYGGSSIFDVCEGDQLDKLKHHRGRVIRGESKRGEYWDRYQDHLQSQNEQPPEQKEEEGEGINPPAEVVIPGEAETEARAALQDRGEHINVAGRNSRLGRLATATRLQEAQDRGRRIGLEYLRGHSLERDEASRRQPRNRSLQEIEGGASDVEPMDMGGLSD